ncbi:hypothetical protein HBHAL_4973 [Halobacillus halophilus DSM 2266]|uniref:Uncharacterized protein n=1 Tax=Halobacillus halophilus (strain ATCC 35676 / DSM 2266 / JCM 20832 / KCTC 3685 / LMG 17431 / NBRC 102448 / NCIMB 2269) TaxID=866895 RepID=I0JT38_HALH3|nr:hypothetical protein HBHAL_4973 [Halobacillus halophilus DSM 2266]
MYDKQHRNRLSFGVLKAIRFKKREKIGNSEVRGGIKDET